MTPREFYTVYGPVRSRTVTLNSVDVFEIPENPDRYLFGIFVATGQLSLFMGDSTEATDVPLIIPPGTGSTLFTFALHGALPCNKWKIQTLLIPNPVVYLEGLMVDRAGKVSVSVYDAPRKNKKRRGRRNGG